MMMIRLFVVVFVAATGLFAFDKAIPGYQFEFPKDHFEHPEFEIEWWYYTGNLKDADNRRFGFELTFFRLAIDKTPAPGISWDDRQLYLAHFALTDIARKRFFRRERVNRSGPGLAGASVQKQLIWNGNWSVSWLPGNAILPKQRLQAVSREVSLTLHLQSLKPAVIHGKDGISQKSSGAGKASHYISLTRMQANGSIVINDLIHEVEGTVWMDHEFSTDSMGSGQQGWDWMSMQLEDGSDLMLYGLRDMDNLHGKHSSGTFIDPKGQTTHLSNRDFRLIPGRKWESPDTGASYPVEWKIEIPVLDMKLVCNPLLDSQEILSELNATPVYWEGAVTYRGDRAGNPAQGIGYLEMTGYDKQVLLGIQQ